MGYSAGNSDLNILNTDMYQITMSQAWFDEGTHEEESVYYLHWRKPPFDASYTCVAGLEQAIDFLNNFGFSDDDIEYLREQNDGGVQVFKDDYLKYLRGMKLSLDIDALNEGEVMTCEAPVIRIKGPRIQGQLVESLLLQIMNSNSIIATRASILGEATEHQPIADFSLRRAANPGPSVSRSSFIGGAVFTASAYASKILGIPATGTMAHAFIMSYQQDGVPNSETELRAFKAYMKSMPTRTVMLVDTYDTEQGIRNAIRASIETRIPLKGIRLDSGDIYALAWKARDMLDAAKAEYPVLFEKTNIYATDGLDEKKIVEFKERSLKETGKQFPVTVWGVGTNLGNPGPFNGGVYKICARAKEVGSKLWQICMKVAGINPADDSLPSSKASIPGIDLDVLRLWKDGKIVADIIVDTTMDVRELLKSGKVISMADNKTEIQIPEFDKFTTLLTPVFKRNSQGISDYVFNEPAKKTLYNGKVVTDLSVIRNFHIAQKEALPEGVVKAKNPEKMLVLIDPRIQQERIKIIAKTKAEQTPASETRGELKVDEQAHQRVV